MLEIDGAGSGREVWKKRRGLASEFATPVFVDGLVFAISGASARAGAIRAIDPDHLMGDLLFPIASLSVALILFEGGLSLRFSELEGAGGARPDHDAYHRAAIDGAEIGLVGHRPDEVDTETPLVFEAGRVGRVQAFSCVLLS